MVLFEPDARRPVVSMVRHRNIATHRNIFAAIRSGFGGSMNSIAIAAERGGGSRAESADSRPPRSDGPSVRS
jgi:hypothetical protein